MKILIENGADVDAKDKLNETPLLLAMSNCSNKEGRIIIEILINSKANVNVLANEEGYSPLHGAITMGNEYMVSYLIQNGANVNLKTLKTGESPISWAVVSVNTILPCLKALEINSPLNYQKALESRENIIQMLMDNGADVDALDNNGFMPLYYAAKANDNQQAFKILIQNGAEVNCMIENYIPLIYLILHEKLFDCAKTLLENGADLDAIGEYGYTILMHAVMDHGVNKIPEVIKWLLENGANGNARNKYYGCTAMHLAIEEGFDDIVTMMIGYGISLNLKNYDGNNSFEYALDKEEIKVFKAILIAQHKF